MEDHPNHLIFAINGERFELSRIDPSTTLLEFIRTQTRFKGTKLSCGEGGCGACVVLLSKYDPALNQVEDFTVSSCLTLLCSIDGCSVTTTEGIGNSRDGFHSIQKRFAGFHASQCGFCTPGMCMSFFSALLNAERNQKGDPPPGFSNITMSEAEKSISGNLCRCTGYRPIADACKSYARDVDIEDLGLNSFWSKEDSAEVKISKLPAYTRNHVCTFPEFMKDATKSKALFDSEDCCWYTPNSIEDVDHLMKYLNVNSDKSIKLVVGNTSTGYYKDLKHYDKYIDLRNIPELSMIKRHDTGIEIGAAVTISKAIKALIETGKSISEPTTNMVLVATRFIRNTASLGGNLIMAQRDHFPSDIATVLGTGTLVHIHKDGRRVELTLDEFLEGPALAFLNAAFLAQFTTGQSSDSIVVENVHLAFGAYGTKHAIRAKNVEEYLNGKSIGAGVLFEAIQLLRATVVSEDGTSSPAYRTSLAVSFLFDFFRPLLEADIKIPIVTLDGYMNTLAAPITSSKLGPVEQPKLLSAKQTVQISGQYHPVGEPTKKAGAENQASGLYNLCEAVYVDDIPSPKDCVHGAFINGTRPLARVKSVGFRSSSPLDGVLKVISSKDIPEGGENVGCAAIFGSEPLFADDLTQFAGQPLGFVVADTQKHADMAANLAVVEYDTENLESPILTVEEAVQKSSFFEVPPYLYPKPVGDFSKGMEEADHKILSAEIKLGSQYYFYMETQTALAIPDEDNCMVIYSSIQCPENAGMVVARCLGVPNHNIRVITRRVGGGFGGKAMRAMPVASACALAAHNLRRPVRIYVNRKTDMLMAGGRHPMKINYSVGFKSDGKITALHLDIIINAGISTDISPIMPQNILGVVKKYNWGALSFDIKVCKTNHSSKSAMRAPGEVQASYIAEAVIENVASYLSLEVDSVRRRNIHTYDSLTLFYKDVSGDPLEYTLPSILDKLANSSRLHERFEITKRFNNSNAWRKKGISCVPIVQQVTVRATPGKVSILNDGSIVVEVGGIELGQGLWTKVKQMVAFGLSSIGCDGSGELLERVRVIQADTLSLVQGGFTAGSTTSESSCEAVRLCCNILVERLTLVKESCLKTMGSVSWNTLITQATMQSVSLSASTYFIPDPSSTQYLNYGAAVSEVEIDLLTGATTILQSDIIYDSGQSLNPAVDLGQIEGAFVQGIGFFMQEEYLANSHGMVVTEGTFDYKIPTIDTIPKQINVEILSSGHHQKRVLSSKASGEPPLLLAVSVHCATIEAIKAARKQMVSWGGRNESYSKFLLDVPATMPVVKELCGLDNVDRYLESLISGKAQDK
ncbi:hypothetical protein ACHQM5_019704 [Ranunculus cassubicifolius]